jgi:hypothetical protein
MTYNEMSERVYETAKSHGFRMGQAHLSEDPYVALREQAALSWLERYAPMDDEAKTALAMIRRLSYKVNELMIDRKLLLAIGELVEAQNELRTGHLPNEVYYGDGGKPEGFGMEIADAHIRLMNLESDLALDGAGNIIEKDYFNQTRPFKHGKKF